MEMIKQLAIKALCFPAMALCSLLVATGPTEASPITYSFTGAVSEVTGVLFPTIGTGSMSGDITFESSAAPIVSGVYLNTVVTGLNLHIGSYTASYALGSNGVVITNSPPMGGADTFTAFTTATGGSINLTSPSSFLMSFTDPSGNAFSNVSLPDALDLLDNTSPPSLSSFASNQWRLIFGNESDGNVVKGSFGTLVATPLPASAILFGVGLIALVGLGAGGLRNLRRPNELRKIA